jgi:hypothetical protein
VGERERHWIFLAYVILLCPFPWTIVRPWYKNPSADGNPWKE